MHIHIRPPFPAVSGATAIIEIQHDVTLIGEVAVEDVAQLLVAAPLFQHAGCITGAMNKQYGRPGRLVSIFEVVARRQQNFGSDTLLILARGS